MASPTSFRFGTNKVCYCLSLLYYIFILAHDNGFMQNDSIREVDIDVQYNR
jgi:hypothetical protein